MQNAKQLILTLTSGTQLVPSGVVLFPELKIQQVMSIKAKAYEEMGGYSTRIGFWGSPGWVIGGTAALDMLESIVSKSKMKKGLAKFAEASEKLESLKKFGIVFAPSEINKIEDPNPASWKAVKKSDYEINLKDMGLYERSNIIKNLQLRRSDIKHGIAKYYGPLDHILYENEFIWFEVDAKLIAVRWSSVESYQFS